MEKKSINNSLEDILKKDERSIQKVKQRLRIFSIILLGTLIVNLVGVHISGLFSSKSSMTGPLKIFTIITNSLVYSYLSFIIYRMVWDSINKIEKCYVFRIETMGIFMKSLMEMGKVTLDGMAYFKQKYEEKKDRLEDLVGPDFEDHHSGPIL